MKIWHYVAIAKRTWMRAKSWLWRKRTLPTDDIDFRNASQTSKCIYCDRPGPFDDEHVLARAFAGPGENWMLKDLVCRKCNHLFSTYERAWTSAPGEAAARIHWGPAGRERKGVAYQVHPSEHVF